jgi:hypothetical protein
VRSASGARSASRYPLYAAAMPPFGGMLSDAEIANKCRNLEGVAAPRANGQRRPSSRPETHQGLGERPTRRPARLRARRAGVSTPRGGTGLGAPFQFGIGAQPTDCRPV